MAARTAFVRAFKLKQTRRSKFVHILAVRSRRCYSSLSSNGGNNSRVARNYNPLIVSGPSGVGKGTIISYFLSNHTACFGTTVSHTTRAPRAGEVDGVHYQFVTKDAFEAGIENGAYIEHAITHGNYYGTHTDEIARLGDSGKISFLDIDVKGAQQIRERHPELQSKFMFVTIESPFHQLQERIKKRGTETDEQITSRLDTAKVELDFLESNPSFFDYILYNGDFEDCIDEMSAILRKWYPWLAL